MQYTTALVNTKKTALVGLVEMLQLVLMISIILGGGALFYLLFALAYLLEPAIGLIGAFGIIGCVCLSILVVVVLLRKQLIINPIVRFLYKLFLKDM